MARNEAVGKARYELETDPTKLKKGLDDAGKHIKQTGAETEKAFGQQSTGAISRFSQGIDGLVGRFNRIAQGGGVGGALLGGIGLGAGLSAFNMVSGAISGVMDNVGRSMDLASDKAEAASKANALFGTSYSIIERASKTAATSVGLSSGAYIAAAGTVGNLITNLGFAGDAAASMSRDIVALSADMGSFNNAGTEDVVDAIGAAFRGETEPIRRFGVMLSAAKVEAKALEMGLKDGKKPLTDNAKAMATYQLILEQTAKAQGDFARTAEEKANADRIRAAKSEEAWTKLGEVLTPIYQKIMPLIAETATTAIDTITNLAKFAAPLVDLALQAIATAIDTIGDSFTALKELMDPTGTEADKVTRAIMEQAKALGLDGDAVVQYTERLKAQAKAERDRLLIAKQIADLDATIAGYIENARLEIDEYVKAIEEGGDAEQFNNIIMERKLQLNAQLAPYLNERNRLLGIQQNLQNDANKVDNEAIRITGLASAALAEYMKHQDELMRGQQVYLGVVGLVTSGVEEQTAAVTEQAASYKTVSHAVKNTIDSMFMALSDAKGPWKDQWQNLAAWAKDPFTPAKFEDWIDGRVKKAMKKARESFGAEKRRWLEIARAYRWIAKNEWIDPMEADIEKIMFALRLASQITDAAKGGRKGGKNDDTIGRNASGTDYWRGGWTWVGEEGRELVRLPQGTVIKSNPESMRMASMLSGTIEVVVRDPDGGLARAGIGSRDLGSRIGDVLIAAERSAGARYSGPR